MSTDYRGIDYGLGQTNVDRETGIRYGVINQNGAVLQAWAESSEPWYPDPECECGLPINMDDGKYTCECGEDINPDWAMGGMEPASFVLDDGEYLAECGDSGDIFIMKSPYFTYAQFCSPCAPGACYLENPLETPHNDNRAYCFGHDWFEDDQAPYPVFEVATGKLVDPPKE